LLRREVQTTPICKNNRTHQVDRGTQALCGGLRRHRRALHAYALRRRSAPSMTARRSGAGVGAHTRLQRLLDQQDVLRYRPSPERYTEVITSTHCTSSDLSGYGSRHRDRPRAEPAGGRGELLAGAAKEVGVTTVMWPGLNCAARPPRQTCYRLARIGWMEPSRLFHPIFDEGGSSRVVAWHAAIQIPKYAALRCSSCSRAGARPDSTMRPDSMT
jgi:hypothetical protein